MGSIKQRFHRASVLWPAPPSETADEEQSTGGDGSTGGDSSTGDEQDDEKYMLCSDLGTYLWNKHHVYEFIKERPSDAFEIAKEHSSMLGIYENYSQYADQFGFGSLVDDIHRLAYSSGMLVKDLSDAASKMCYNDSKD